jgi:hypothetical protein
MLFNYKWTTKEEGNYAIRKREAKGREAGKEIEPKNRQASDTHFFIWVDKNDTDTMYNLYKINTILKTITYEYVYRGIGKKSTTKYLTKKDIENVIENIEAYKGKTIRIETAFSKVIQQKKEKLLNAMIKKIKEKYENQKIDETKKDTKEKKYGFQNIEKVFKLLQVNIEKENELKKETKEAGIQIKKLNKEIQKIKTDLAERRINAKAEKEKMELSVFRLLFGDKNDDFKGTKEYTDGLESLYELAKADKQRQTRNETQRRHNKKKKVENGKPKKET